MKATVETKEITVTTRVYTLEVTHEELLALDMGMSRMSSSYVTRKNLALAGTVAAITNEISKLVDGTEENKEASEYDEDEEDDDL